MYIGNRDSIRMLTAVRKLCGHDSTGPTGVFDQSIERMRSPVSPPPWRSACEELSRVLLDTMTSPRYHAHLREKTVPASLEFA
jgi:hypothetical protein